MKTTEAWSTGVFPHLHSWNDPEQIVGNRVKWRAAVHQLGDHWAFLRVQEKLTEDANVRTLRKVKP